MLAAKQVNNFFLFFPGLQIGDFILIMIPYVVSALYSHGEVYYCIKECINKCVIIVEGNPSKSSYIDIIHIGNI